MEPNRTPEEWLADPNRAAAPPEAQTPPRPEAEAPEPDAGIGTPRQVAAESRPVADRDSLLKLAGEQYQALEELEDELGQPEPGESWLKKSGLTSLVLGLSALAILVMFSQVLSFISYLSAFPAWLRWSGYALGAGLSLAALFCLGRFVANYLRLEKSPRISLSAMQELAQRGSLRRQADAEMDQARTYLVGFLEKYPLDKPAELARLRRLGFSPEQLELLQNNRKQLLQAAAEESTETWLIQFERRYLAILDQVAKSRISRYAWLVGLKTAAAPTGLVDTSIVLINAYRLMDDLCRIYRLRAGGMGTASILLRIFVNAFAAARIEEWMDNAANQIVDAAAQGSDGMAAFFKVISGGVLSRMAEGGANAFLLVRLGAAAMHYLRPMSEKPVRK